ncbi:MAG: ATP-dependent DNA helicase, partial [Actinomycetota bacterium]|nr:ATP-dependent DNA helicase [Actinomycetota bacterium]
AEGDPGPERSPLLEPPPIAAEQEEARLALQGLDGLSSVFTAKTRVYDGPAEPEALLDHVGLDCFRPGQREAVEAALAGRDSMIVMPTGGGKSLCYQLPGLASAELTIVVSPLIALMADQWRKLAENGHPVVMIASGMGAARTREALDRVGDGSARIIYCSPERFGSTAFLDAIGRRDVDLLAIDEAHCISEWGHDFRPDYLRLPKVVTRLGRPTVMACTATATAEVADEVRGRLGLSDPLEVRSGFDRPNLSFDTLTFQGTGSKARKLAILEQSLRDESNRPAIVYCGTRRDTDEVAEAMRGAGLLAAPYHAGLAPDERASTQLRFMTGDADVIVATNAFGMGVDKANVRSVWHWAIPSSVEAYYQEAGRAGRDGKPARAALLASRADLGRLVRFIEQRKVDPTSVISYVERLGARSESGGELEMDNPRDDAERVRLAIAEREGAISIEPAIGGRLLVSVNRRPERAATEAACRVATDRGWRAYRAVEAYSFSERCRRRALLDHFGDSTPGAPSGRCCDVCDADTAWLPDPETITVTRSGKRARGETATPVEDLSGPDAELFERLRAWRREAAKGKPAYTVANDRTLTEIASSRPGDEAALAGIHGVGPAFIKRHAGAVLELLAEG